MYQLLTHWIFHQQDVSNAQETDGYSSSPGNMDDPQDHGGEYYSEDKEEEASEESMQDQLKTLFMTSLNALNDIAVPEIIFEVGHLKQVRVTINTDEMDHIVFKCDSKAQKVSLTVQNIKQIAERLAKRQMW